MKPKIFLYLNMLFLVAALHGCGRDSCERDSDSLPNIGDNISKFHTANIIESNEARDKYIMIVKGRSFYFYATTDKSGTITSIWTRGQ